LCLHSTINFRPGPRAYCVSPQCVLCRSKLLRTAGVRVLRVATGGHAVAAVAVLPHTICRCRCCRSDRHQCCRCSCSSSCGCLPRQFDSIIQSLNYLRDRSSDSRDSGDVPGRMLVLHHAWYLVNKHPNLRLDEHPAAAVKKVYIKWGRVVVVRAELYHIVCQRQGTCAGMRHDVCAARSLMSYLIS
jgi:hypothetical protein